MSINGNLPPGFRRAMSAPAALKSPQEMGRISPERPLERVLMPQTTVDIGNAFLEAFIPCEVPTRTAQQKGACVVQGKIRFFTKKVVKEAEKQWRTILLPYVPATPFTGPIRLEITLHFPWRKGDSKLKAQFRVVPIDTRPDAENIFKACGDQMTVLGFWKDDSQIAELTVRKFRSDTPGLHLKIQPSTPTTR